MQRGGPSRICHDDQPYQRDAATSKLAKTRSCKSLGLPLQGRHEEARSAAPRRIPSADGLSRSYTAVPVFQPGARSAQLKRYSGKALRPLELSINTTTLLFALLLDIRCRNLEDLGAYAEESDCRKTCTTFSTFPGSQDEDDEPLLSEQCHFFSANNGSKVRIHMFLVPSDEFGIKDLIMCSKWKLIRVCVYCEVYGQIHRRDKANQGAESRNTIIGAVLAFLLQFTRIIRAVRSYGVGA